MTVKDKDLYLTSADLLRNLFFMDQLKAAVMNFFFNEELLLIFVSLFIFPFFNAKYFKLIYFSIFFFEKEVSPATVASFSNFSAWLVA